MLAWLAVEDIEVLRRFEVEAWAGRWLAYRSWDGSRTGLLHLELVAVFRRLLGGMNRRRICYWKLGAETIFLIVGWLTKTLFLPVNR